MNNMQNIRVSIPGKINDLIWCDEEFYNFIAQNKKAQITSKFPRYDQWCADDGLYMAFALAGYSAADVNITTRGNELLISSNDDTSNDSKYFESDQKDIDNTNDMVENLSNAFESLSDDQSAVIDAKIKRPYKSTHVDFGVIVRGIARRKFKTKFVLNDMFDLGMIKASMKNGLLEVFIPRKEHETKQVLVEIKEK
jgi:HSP20 family molecular chaperone IbpA